MTAKHTPGPWVWSEDHPTNACANVRAKTESGWYEDIATLYGCSDDVPRPSMPEEPWGDHPIRRANARLIAAAPELLEALKDMVLLSVQLGATDMEVAEAMDAIAKAEGNAQ